MTSLDAVRALENLRLRVGKLESYDAPLGMARIEIQVLTGGLSSITFSSIPPTVNHLVLMWQARGEAVATSAALLLRFNGDTTAAYDYSLNQTANSTNTATTATAQTAVRGGIMTAASAAAGLAGAGVITIYNINGTAFQKELTYECHVRLGTGAADIVREDGAGNWRSTSAITSLTVLASSSNLAASSLFTLYGVT